VLIKINKHDETRPYVRVENIFYDNVRLICWYKFIVSMKSYRNLTILRIVSKDAVVKLKFKVAIGN
jgi:hypothetical protein